MSETIKELFTNDKADELITAITSSSSSKIEKQQGVINKGKALFVGNDGNVAAKQIEGSDVTISTGVTLTQQLSNLSGTIEEVSGDVSDLRGDLSDVEDALGQSPIDYSVTVGGNIANDGSDSTSTTYSRIDWVDVKNYDSITFELSNMQVFWYGYDSEKQHIRHQGWITEDTTIDTKDFAYIRAVVRIYTRPTSPTEEETKNGVIIISSIIGIKDKLDDLSDSIANLETTLDNEVNNGVYNNIPFYKVSKSEERNIGTASINIVYQIENNIIPVSRKIVAVGNVKSLRYPELYNLLQIRIYEYKSDGTTVKNTTLNQKYTIINLDDETSYLGVNYVVAKGITEEAKKDLIDFNLQLFEYSFDFPDDLYGNYVKNVATVLSDNIFINNKPIFEKTNIVPRNLQAASGSIAIPITDYIEVSSSKIVVTTKKVALKFPEKYTGIITRVYQYDSENTSLGSTDIKNKIGIVNLLDNATSIIISIVVSKGVTTEVISELFLANTAIYEYPLEYSLEAFSMMPESGLVDNATGTLNFNQAPQYTSVARNIKSYYCKPNTCYRFNWVFNIVNNPSQFRKPVLRIYFYDSAGTRVGSIDKNENNCVIKTPDECTKIDIATATVFTSTPESAVSDTINYNYNIYELPYSEAKTPIHLRVCSYNVGGYDYGRMRAGELRLYLNEKYEAVKQFFADNYLDIICCQEDSQLTAGSGETSDDLYTGNFPWHYRGAFILTTSSKYPIVKQETGTFENKIGTDGRGWQISEIYVDGRIIALANCHLAFQTDGASTRNLQKQELVAKLAEYDYVLVFGDFNAVTPEEFDNDAFENAGFVRANGGYMAIAPTYPAYGTPELPLDNVFCKSPNKALLTRRVINPIIADLDVTPEPEIEGYVSDHLPLYVDVTLT